MRPRSLAIVSCLCALCLRADQVTLKNGDRITGSVVRKDEKTLTMKSEFLGTIAMPWAQVERIATESSVHVVLSSGQTTQGTLTTRDQIVEITAPDARHEVALTEITTLRDTAEQRAYERLLRPAWTRLWSGSATLGFAGTQGNARTQTLTTAFNAGRVTSTDKTTVYFSAIRASAGLDSVSAATARAVRGGWGYNHNVSSRLFLNGFNDYEYDRFQNLDLRFVLGGGLGFIAWRDEGARLDLLGGGALNRESFSPPAPLAAFTRNSGEVYFGNEFTYKLTTVTALYQKFRLFPNLTNTGEYRMNFDLGADTKLARWLTWNVAVSNRYLSNPAPGRQRNDLLYTTGIGLTFAR